jgi:hypothetical protein
MRERRWGDRRRRGALVVVDTTSLAAQGVSFYRLGALMEEVTPSPEMGGSMAKQAWHFFRTGGVDQVQLTRGAELAALDQLDQKRWMALSCPVKGLEFDERTLALIDEDGDGRVRAPELIQTGKWAAAVLNDVEQLGKSAPALPLSAIQTTTDEGKLLLATAKALLKAIDKPDATAISVDDAVAGVKAFDKEHENGDGIVPASAVKDDVLRALVEELLKVTADPKKDRCGEAGLSADDINAFFAAAAEHVAWLKEGEDAAILPLGGASADAWAAYAAVAAKVDDYFARTRVAAFDQRALPSLNRDEGSYAEFTVKALSKDAGEIGDFPLARVEPDATLPLRSGINPAWSAAIAALVAKAIMPILGARDHLTASEWQSIGDKLAAHQAWAEKKAGARVAGLGRARLDELLGGDAKDKLLALVDADKAAADKAAAIEKVEKLVRVNRDLLHLANNFVSFRDFYAQKAPAIFQVGTLYLDQRACTLCIEVNDAGKHATMAPLSRAFLVYCDLKNEKGDKKTIAAAITDGDTDNIMVGRNGLFYDRNGNDWDATVTKIVDNPISIRQAFWSPYKKLMRLIEEQINKRAAAAEKEADAKVNAAAETTDKAATGDVQAPAGPKKLDIGVVAALGVAVGGITAALGMFLTAFFGLGLWMPLGVLGLLLLISGPSMAIAWLKLRQRNIGPLLDANGWAVNAMACINVPFGKSLTSVAALPEGSSRDLVDPFAEKKKPWWLLVLLAVILGGAFAWYIGKLDGYLPPKAKSTEVLGEAAPAHVKPKEASAAEAPPAG